MPELIIEYILPFLLGIGFVAFGMKAYFNFKYFKIVYNYPTDLTYSQFISSFRHFWAAFETILPFYLKNNLETLTEDEKLICRKLEKYMFICLTMFYIGLLTIPIGIKLQEYYKI
jgi:hypothetical protein